MLKVILLGLGCPNCKKVEQLCYDIAAENNLDMNLEKNNRFQEICRLRNHVHTGIGD